MNKTFKIRLSEQIFVIDENAYYKLERFLNTAKSRSGKNSISNDSYYELENKIAKIFLDISQNNRVISYNDVENALASLGQTIEYQNNNKKNFANSNNYEWEKKPHKKLYRDTNHRIIGGVCSGLANHFSIDPIIIRILAIFITFMVSPLVYIIFWIVIPKSNGYIEQYGLNVKNMNFSNIEYSVKKEFNEIKYAWQNR